MASRFWVGGTGNWDASDTTHWSATSGGGGGASVPTSSDDVTFDSASNATAYTVTITAAANCANFTMAGPLSGKVTWAGSSALNIYGNMNLSGGTAGITRTYTGAITFAATATGKTITLNSVVLASSVTFNGVGGGWTLQDTFNIGANGNITLSNGSLDTNDQTLTLNSLVSSTSTARGLSLGSSTINLGNLQITNTTNLTFDAETSTIVWSNSNLVSFSPAGLSYYNFTFNGGAAVASGVQLTGNMTVTNNLVVAGNSATNRLLIATDTVGTARTITCTNAPTVSNADFRDITGAGAGSWNISAATGGSGDCGGNSGITFTTPVDQHWIKAGGAGGNWSGGATNWTTRSPLPQDDVYFDFAFGTSQTVTADMPRLGKSIDWTGATWTTGLTWAMSTTASLFGSLTMIDNLTMSGTNTYTFAGRGSYTFHPHSLTFIKSLTLEAKGGTLTLQGNLTLSASRTLRVSGGTFTCVNGGSNYALSVGFLATDATITNALVLGSATHLITGASTTVLSINSSANSTLTAGSSTLKFTDTANGNITVGGGGKTFNNIWFNRGASTGSITLSGSNTFADFKDDGTAAHSLIFTASTTTTVATWNVTGNGSGNAITLTSTTATDFNLVKSGGGQVACDWLNIQNCDATPTATWCAGANSVDNQGATGGTGWYFQACPIVVGMANLKSYNTNLFANIKSIDTNLIANIKSLDTNV